MTKENLAKNLAVIVKGFIAMVMQILIMREFLIIFSGNELSLGIILANWLFLEALGSGLLAKFFTKIKDNIKAYAILQIFIILSLTLTIWLVRTARANLGIFYGEVLNLPQMFLISFITLLIFGLLDGLQFFFACRMLSEKNFASNITKAYILEALGMLLGGIIFTYVFLPLFNSFQIAILLSCIAILITLYLCLVTHLNNIRTIAGLLVFLLILNLFLTITGKINSLQKISLQRQFPKQKILDYQNSIYGNVMVTQQQNQLTFFSNGVPAVVTPITDITFAEDYVHLTLLNHPKPQNILLISGGAGGILNEILKEPVSGADYAELNPLIIREIKKFPTQLTLRELNDRRVNIIYRDGRSFVKNTQKKYDAVFINLSIPTTLQANRLLTEEFYREVEKILSPGGIISVRLPGSLTYLNEELKQLNDSIYKTLSSVFRYTLVIPGDFNLFLASDSLDLQNMATQTIISRFKERNLKTHLLTTLSLNYRLDKTRREWFFEQIKPLKNSEFLNRDFSPRGLFYGLAFAYSFISPQTKNVFKILSKGNLPYITVLILMIFLLGIFLSRKSKNKLNLNILWLISFSGFSGIAFELILILGFQVIYGFIYAWVGVLSGAFMSGLASGSFILSRSLNKIKNDFATLLKFEFAIIAFSLALPVLIFVLSKANQQTLASLTKLIFIAVSFIAGFLLGAEFPLANKIYFARQEFVNSGAQLYAADLTGACLGAIISSVVLIPILGIWETGLFIACLKLAAVIAIIFSVRK